MFPEHRPRRLRSNDTIRKMVRETHIHPDQLIFPLFVKEGKGIHEPIASMPGQYRYSPDALSPVVNDIVSAGIPAVLLFGIPLKKDSLATGAHKRDGIVQQAIGKIKNAAPELMVITDVCLCEYTDHGHCGILDEKNRVSNDDTIEILSKVALSHAKAGSDMIAPSDMMDGRVGIIRDALDESGFEHLPILSYAVKYASSFYGPFREAAGSAPSFGDRKSYQMDPANVREALREARFDVEEGADIIMVKPALPYLDVIRTIADEFDEPLCAYQVSGEYAMIKAAASGGWLAEEACIMESITSIKRAGADMIITYFAREIARILS
ncbi:MAG TPA: porphobilinogen synthase [Deltaproteobacteria bacterium]|nr:porphobilinogen synthase [Deltaproteobacteria bacterium]